MTWLIFLWFGCTSTSEPNNEPEVELVDTSSVDVEEEVIGEGELEPPQQQNARHRMRMTIDQLQSSMYRVTEVEWKDGNADLWNRYSTTLGVPDYLENMTEDLTPSVIFQKFLNDAAVASCSEWIELDLTRVDKQFFVHVTFDESGAVEVKNNIEYLRYRIHGQRSSDEDPFIASLEELYSLVLQRTDDTVVAWNTVCVAFFTHPDFYTF